MKDNNALWQKKAWNSYYETNTEIPNDPWLESLERYFPKGDQTRVLDLGCGTGLKVDYYRNRNWQMSLLDISQAAIDMVQARYPDVDARVCDMAKGLPYADNEFSVIIADLSLHYFSSDNTQFILREIRRLMQQDAVFLGRLNSSKDVNHGAGEGDEIEPGYYRSGQRYKRFFSEEMLQEFMKEYFHIELLQEVRIFRYATEKVAWLFVATLRSGSQV